MDVLALLCQAFFASSQIVLAGFAIRNHHYTFYFFLAGVGGLILIGLSSRIKRLNSEIISTSVNFIHKLLATISVVGFAIGLLLMVWVVYVFIL
jgi:hypothetical protein